MDKPRAPFGPVAAAVTILFFYALDQWTKRLVILSIPYDSERIIIPGFFSLVHWVNTGAAFSSFSQKNGLFIALSIVTLIVLAIFAVRGAFRHTTTRIAVCLLTSGVLGNVTDRIRHHHVIDFLLFNLHIPFANPWPAFNVADSCICLAAAILVITAWMEDRKPTST
ncbi:MAG: signal peptidase II [Chthoniobacteraceae bacterium]|jgi:signal peptidase II